MKVLLVCAGGCSTSILMKKLMKYAEDNGIPLEEIKATGIHSYMNHCHKYDIILMGPQMGYQKDDVIKGSGGMPVEVIPPADYGIGNCKNIFKLIDKCMAQLEEQQGAAAGEQA